MGAGKKTVPIPAVLLILLLWKPLAAVIALIFGLGIMYVIRRSSPYPKALGHGNEPVFLGKGITLDLAGYAIR